MARLDFLRFHRNRCVSNGSGGLHRTTFQPSSYCLHFRFHLMTKLPVTQVDSTVFPVSFFYWTPSDSRFCPLESGQEYWTCVDRYILCPKPPYPAEKTLDRRQLFFLAVPPWPVIKILCPSRTIFSAWRWSSESLSNINRARL